jgi:hypothetical protein
MNRNMIIVLAFVGAASALIAAIGISSLFLRFATETYTRALEPSGFSGGLKAAMELQRLHENEAERGMSVRAILARSIMAHGGLVYTDFPRNEACKRQIEGRSPRCEGFGCVWLICGVNLIYAADFSDISYNEGKIQIPPPRFSLWIYTLGVGALKGIAIGVKKVWIRYLAVAVIVGVPVWLLTAPQSPVTTTVFLSGSAGGVMALVTYELFRIAFPEKVIKTESDNVRAWLWRARFAETNAERVIWYHKVLEIDPSNEEAKSMLAVLQPHGFPE